MDRRLQGNSGNIPKATTKLKGRKPTDSIPEPTVDIPTEFDEVKSKVTQLETDVEIINNSELNAVKTQIKDIEDTRAPWIDVINLQEDKITKDQAINTINTQISDLDATKAATVTSITTGNVDPSGLVTVNDAAVSYDQSQVQELVDAVNSMKDILVAVAELTNEEKAKINQMNNF